MVAYQSTVKQPKQHPHPTHSTHYIHTHTPHTAYLLYTNTHSTQTHTPHTHAYLWTLCEQRDGDCTTATTQIQELNAPSWLVTKQLVQYKTNQLLEHISLWSGSKIKTHSHYLYRASHWEIWEYQFKLLSSLAKYISTTQWKQWADIEHFSSYQSSYNNIPRPLNTMSKHPPHTTTNNLPTQLPNNFPSWSPHPTQPKKWVI